MMKNKLITLSLIAAFSGATNANDPVKGESWVGGFFEYYNADNEKFSPGPEFEDGLGLGLEYGYKFNPSWAGRIEWSHLNLDTSTNDESIGGDRAGIDALFFPQQSHYYVFAGLKYEDFEQSSRLGNLGLGIHWDTNPKWRVITEIATYHDFGEGFQDYGLKLGVAYKFGGSTIKSRDTDTDKDGVPDSRDACKNSPLNSKVDEVGCALIVTADSDGDGVKDTTDRCPNTPKGKTVDQYGCEVIIDTDRDGVADTNDQCANTPRTDKVDANGCSIFEEQEVEIRLNIQFANNSSKVPAESTSQLREFAQFLSRYPDTKAVIEGHSSAPGDEQYNLWISKKRAESVKQALIEQFAVKESRLTAIGFGETQLIDTQNTAAAHAKNRRIVANVTAIEKRKVTK